MRESGYYPPGAEFDKNAPYNEPIPINIKVEVGVELGLFINVEVNSEDEIKEAVKQAIYDKFKTKDIEVNEITIWNYDFPSKW